MPRSTLVAHPIPVRTLVQVKEASQLRHSGAYGEVVSVRRSASGWYYYTVTFAESVNGGTRVYTDEYHQKWIVPFNPHDPDHVQQFLEAP